MMGTKARLFTPVPSVSLEVLVPADHFYRHLDQGLDLSFVRDLVKDCYTQGGRPSIDPVVFFKLQLVMFFEGLRSERQLLRLAADRLSVRWYLGFNLDEPLPDHSSLTRIRTRYGLEIFRRFFAAVVEQCQQAGLVWGKELYFDATQVKADAAMDSLTTRFAVEARAERAEPQGNEQDHKQAHKVRADVEQHLEALFPLVSPPFPGLNEEELVAMNTVRHDWVADDGRQQREVTHGYRPRTADFRISTTDQDATPVRLKGGGTHLGYQTHYVVDGGKSRIIMSVLVTPGEVMENQPMLDLLWHTCFRYHVMPKQITGDTTYGTVENIAAVEREGIRAYVPLPNWEHKTGYLGPSHFTYDAEQDVYLCSHGAMLRRRRVEYTSRRVEYGADAATCNVCPLKAQCTPSNQGRVVHRHFDEAYLDRVRAYHKTADYQKAMRKRKVWVEPLFAEAKEWHGLRQFRLRRLWRVNIEALLMGVGQNLKRLMAKRGWGRRPLPNGSALTAQSRRSVRIPHFTLVEFLIGVVERHSTLCRHFFAFQPAH
ncbi:MAG: IS1182 family transposase [Chloroflexota bacterium]